MTWDTWNFYMMFLRSKARYVVKGNRVYFLLPNEEILQSSEYKCDGMGRFILGDNMAFEVTGPTLTFKFDSEEAAEHFKVWMCESGEQSYWEWMEYREQEEEGDITGVCFSYHNEDGSIIPVECGRLNR